jgi:hypothetical protein
MCVCKHARGNNLEEQGIRREKKDFSLVQGKDNNIPNMRLVI